MEVAGRLGGGYISCQQVLKPIIQSDDFRTTYYLQLFLVQIADALRSVQLIMSDEEIALFASGECRSYSMYFNRLLVIICWCSQVMSFITVLLFHLRIC